MALASVLRGAGCGAVVVVLLRPDGTYCVQPLAEAPAAPTPPAADRDAAHLGVARAALRELHERRLRDGVARRLLREAGVIEDQPKRQLG